MLTEFLKSILVGICAAAPLGPVAALVIQKTLCYGHKTGFVTGLGSAVVDMLYATIGIFAIGLVEAFIEENTEWITIVGGLLVAGVGLYMALRDPFRKFKASGEALGHLSPSYPLQAALFSVANPGALLLMLALVALFGIGDDKLVSLAGIAVGLIVWWFLFSFLVSKFRSKFNINTLVFINKVLGWAVIIFGIVWIVKAFSATIL